ncbi:MAG: cation:proton antiporter [Anaerolineae bacterium]|nr:cation:proton antiporter [Anaerolineae bacterium]
MSPFLQLALALVVIILAAKTGGYISYRLGQPAVLGGLLVGVLLGPSLLDFFHLPIFTAEAHVGETITEMAELGVLLLMFIAGLDLRLSDLIKSGKVSALAGTLGVVTPVLLGTLTGLLFDMTLVSSIFLGLILAATSVSISAQTLMELSALRSRVGISMLGAAVFDDVLVVLGLSIFLALIGDTGAAGLGAVALVLLQMVGYLVIATVVGFYLLPDRLARRVERLPVSQSLLSFAFVTMLLYAWAAEALGGMAAISGAFLAGLIFARSPQKERIETGVMALAYGLFVPIFFVNIGLSANARELIGGSMALMLAMTVVAILSKIIGAGLGGRLGGLTSREALQLGVGMMSRGEVGLIVVSVGVSNGLVSTDVFAAVVGVVILTTLLTPPLLRLLFARNKPSEVAAQKVSPGEVS